MAEPTTGPATTVRNVRPGSGPMPTRASCLRYRTVLWILIALALFFGIGLLVWDNPMPYGSRGFWLIVDLRVTNVVVMAIVATCHAVATVSSRPVADRARARWVRRMAPSCPGCAGFTPARRCRSLGWRS